MICIGANGVYAPALLYLLDSGSTRSRAWQVCLIPWWSFAGTLLATGLILYDVPSRASAFCVAAISGIHAFSVLLLPRAACSGADGAMCGGSLRSNCARRVRESHCVQRFCGAAILLFLTQPNGVGTDSLLSEIINNVWQEGIRVTWEAEMAFQFFHMLSPILAGLLLDASRGGRRVVILGSSSLRELGLMLATFAVMLEWHLGLFAALTVQSACKLVAYSAVLVYASEVFTPCERSLAVPLLMMWQLLAGRLLSWSSWSAWRAPVTIFVVIFFIRETMGWPAEDMRALHKQLGS
jgi:hypothetical protein